MAQSMLEPEEHVLSTLERDGSRRWLRPRYSPGRLLNARRLVAWVLIAIFTLIPYIKLNGKPLVLLDIVHREFTLLGYTFLPTDTLLLALFMVSLLLAVFLLTALFGRLWCGWACPQTVYLEFVYRPIERFFDQTIGRGGDPRKPVAAVRRVLQYVTYLVISLFLAHTFLAYFVGVDQLLVWITGSPLNHPIGFLVMATTTLAMLFDFCYFREQLCIIACPYGRFQSVLLDRLSLIVSYDPKRGEPRGRGKRKRTTDADGLNVIQGDCVDCKLCVTTCPTGIDIRNGLQMECINCAQCIDACNTVMQKLGRRTGLIRYSSQASIEGEPRKLLRPRVVIYPLLLLIFVSVTVTLLVGKKPFDAIMLRNLGNPFVIVDDNLIQNTMRLKLTNRTDHAEQYALSIVEPKRVSVVNGEPIHVEAGQSVTTPVHFAIPGDLFNFGVLPLTVNITDSAGESRELSIKLTGPTMIATTPPPAAQSDANVPDVGSNAANTNRQESIHTPLTDASQQGGSDATDEDAGNTDAGNTDAGNTDSGNTDIPIDDQPQD